MTSAKRRARPPITRDITHVLYQIGRAIGWHFPHDKNVTDAIIEGIEAAKDYPFRGDLPEERWQPKLEPCAVALKMGFQRGQKETWSDWGVVTELDEDDQGDGGQERSRAEAGGPQ